MTPAWRKSWSWIIPGVRQRWRDTHGEEKGCTAGVEVGVPPQGPEQEPEPRLPADQQCWIKSGREGEISNALYYQVRAKLGIKTQWMWVKVDDEKPPKSASATTPNQVYQFKITLKDSHPPICAESR